MTSRATEPRTAALRDTDRYNPLHVLNVLLLIGLWLFAALMYRHLPDQIPGHIGTSGVTRWESRESGMWFLMPILGSFHALMMYAFSGIVDSSPAAINVPQKKRLLELPRAGQRYAMEPARALMFGMATWLLVLSLLIQAQLYVAARAGVDGTYAGDAFLVAIIALSAAPLAGVWWLNRAIRRRIDAWLLEHGEAGSAEHA